MTRDEFVKKYTEIAIRALNYSEKARRHGLLALEEDLNHENIDQRDIFDYGLLLVVDAVDAEIIDEVLSNIIKHEKDEDMVVLKNIQKDAVLAIEQKLHPRLIYALLNSHTDITLKDDEVYKMIED